MKLNSLQAYGKRRQRVGRGISAGQGKTAGRGTKGQKARNGKKLRPGFEGGQTPFLQRIPKLKGFTNPNHVSFQVVNVSVLNHLASPITREVLVEAGLVQSLRRPVKVLGDGELSKKLEVVLDAASASAKEKIEKAGGSFQPLAQTKVSA